jgi:hypothetical protein
MATQPVLIKGIDSSNNVLPVSLSATGEMNIASASGLTVSGSVDVGNFPATQPVSAVSLPLPAGASTSALQSATNSGIADMSVKLPLSLGSKSSATSLSITMSSDESPIDVNSVIASASSSDSLTIATLATDVSVSKLTSGFTSVGVIVESTTAEVKTSLQWSHDNMNWYQVESRQSLSTITDASGSNGQNTLYFKVGVLAKYVRVQVYNPDAASASVKVLVNLA